MPEKTQNVSFLVLGGSGRLGRLLRAVWRGRAPRAGPALFQARSGGVGIIWAPGQPMTPLPPARAVVALWGVTAGDAPALAGNSGLAEISRSVARHCGADRVFHFSSAAVYGPAEDATEDTPPAPSSPYGAAKLAMERRVAGFDDPGTAHCCLRLANVVGADSLAPALRGGGPVRLDQFGDGTGPLRAYIGAGGLARVLDALAALSVPDLPPVLNIALPGPLGMEDLARAAGKTVLWQRPPAHAVQRVTLNTQRLQRLLPGLEIRKTATELIAEWAALESRE